MRTDTKCIHAGYTPKNGEPRMIPIIESTTFKYDSSRDMGALFYIKAKAYFYLPPNLRHSKGVRQVC